MVDNLTTLSLCVSSGDLDLFDKKKLKRDIVYISERLEKAVFYKKSCKGEADVIQREIFWLDDGIFFNDLFRSEDLRSLQLAVLYRRLQ